MPISCSKGFKSLPSKGILGSKRSKGLEVNKQNNKKPTPSIPIMDSTLARISTGMERLSIATAAVQALRVNTQSNKEPSWLPQTAVNLYCSGSCAFECIATNVTEKSSCRNKIDKIINEAHTKPKNTIDKGTALSINRLSLRYAPVSGKTARKPQKTNDSISKK